MRACKASLGDTQRPFGLVKSCQQVVVAALRVATWKVVLDERGDPLTVSIDGIADDGEFSGNGRQIDSGHASTLGARQPADGTGVHEWVVHEAVFTKWARVPARSAQSKLLGSRWRGLGSLFNRDPRSCACRFVPDGGLPLSSGGRGHPVEHQ